MDYWDLWNSMLRMPMANAFIQPIAPVTSWFSPQVEMNFAGDAAIEGKVVAKVASYGKQLGALTEAILELADGKPGDKIERLRSIAEQVETVKRQHLETAARASLDALRKSDPDALARVIVDYRSKA